MCAHESMKNPNEMPLRPQSAKSKGRRLQQKVASSILSAFPELEPDDCFSTSMGANGEDVRLSPKARSLIPLSLECKCVEKLNVWGCLEQASSNTPEGATPCLVFSRNRSPTYAVVPWDTLLGLFEAVAHRCASSQDGETMERVRGLVQELSSLVQPEKTSARSLNTFFSEEEDEGMQEEGEI